MAKKYPKGYIKNPAKVAAGKARAAAAIKDKSGRYVSKIFETEVKKTFLATKKVDVSKIAADKTEVVNQLLKDAGITQKEIKKFYDTHQFIFDDMVKNARLKGTSKNSNQLEKALTEYKGKVIIDYGNGKVKEVTAIKADMELKKFKQFLSSELNVVDFTIHPTFDFDGKMTLQVPDAKKLVKDLREYFGLEKDQDFDDIEGAELTDAIKNILQGIYGEDETDIVIYAS